MNRACACVRGLALALVGSASIFCVPAPSEADLINPTIVNDNAVAATFTIDHQGIGPLDDDSFLFALDAALQKLSWIALVIQEDADGDRDALNQPIPDDITVLALHRVGPHGAEVANTEVLAAVLFDVRPGNNANGETDTVAHVGVVPTHHDNMRLSYTTVNATTSRLTIDLLHEDIARGAPFSRPRIKDFEERRGRLLAIADTLAVPEPASLSLLVLGLTAFLAGRRLR